MSPRSSAITGKGPSSFSAASKKSAPGPGRHSPMWAVRRTGRNVPRGGEGPKMIDPHRVDLRNHRPNPIDPPAIAFARKRLPVVQRIAPELAVGAKVIGRNAGNERRPALGVKQEQSRDSPRLRRNWAPPEKGTSPMRRTPLLRAYSCNRRCWRSSTNWAKRKRSIVSASSRLAAASALASRRCQRGGPFAISIAVVSLAHGSKQGVVVEPVCS